MPSKEEISHNILSMYGLGDSLEIEKSLRGRSNAQIGEIREWQGRRYVRTISGWMKMDDDTTKKKNKTEGPPVQVGKKEENRRADSEKRTSDSEEKKDSGSESESKVSAPTIPGHKFKGFEIRKKGIKYRDAYLTVGRWKQVISDPKEAEKVGLEDKKEVWPEFVHDVKEAIKEHDRLFKAD